GWAWLRKGWYGAEAFAGRGGPWPFAALLAAVAGVAAWRRRWRAAGRAAPDAAATVLDRVLRALRRLAGVGQAPGRTPQELAEAAAGPLRAAPATVAFADFPVEAVVYYYRARYGGRPLDAAEHRDLSGRLDALERALPPAGSVASGPPAG